MVLVGKHLKYDPAGVDNANIGTFGGVEVPDGTEIF